MGWGEAAVADLNKPVLRELQPPAESVRTLLCSFVRAAQMYSEKCFCII